MVNANITWLTDSVATGGDLSMVPEEAIVQVDQLLEMGVTHIFDTRIEASDEDVWKHFPSVTYVRYPVDDEHDTHLPKELFDKAVEFAREAAKVPGSKVFLHCHMGINRGPSVAAAVLMDQGMSPLRAFRTIRTKRPQAAVYYFMDAYDAHMKRVFRETGLRPTKAARAHAYRTWLKDVRDPDNVAHVKRAIKAHRAEDNRQWAEAGR